VMVMLAVLSIGEVTFSASRYPGAYHVPVHVRCNTGCCDVGPHVEPRSVKAERLSRFLDGQDHGREERTIERHGIQDGGHMILGDDHDVDLGLRPWVMECQHPVILPDFPNLNLAGEDVFTIPISTCHTRIHLLSTCALEWFVRLVVVVRLFQIRPEDVSIIFRL
jgi:hypothetical protein